MAFRRGLVVAVGFIIQTLFYLFLSLFFVNNIGIINIIYSTLGIIIAFVLIRNSKNYSYTLPWVVILLLFPLLGTLFYILFGNVKNKNKKLKLMYKKEKEVIKYFNNDNNNISGNIKYLKDYSYYSYSTNNKVEYFSTGESGYKDMIKELNKAKKFIFLEYFIIKNGFMWSNILNILEKKLKENVEVRIIYDDFGSLNFPSNYVDFLIKKGIKCIKFNKLTPLKGIVMNNRDHRKIMIIDGKVSYSGGINIGDEYINLKNRFGYWKDNVIKIKGDGVFNYTVMFLTMWNSLKNEDNDFNMYKYNFKNKLISNGYVLPYAQSPLNEEMLGENIYLNIINQAKKYICITTPYLIIDIDMINALILASKRGVKVNIVLPNIPDKKMVYMVTESNIKKLIKNNINIYKYTPGFIHSKIFISDDKIATIGTINMDYRSLYLHFECNCYLEKVDVLKDIKNDINNIISNSHKVTKEEIKFNFFKNLFQEILKIFSPLL